MLGEDEKLDKIKARLTESFGSFPLAENDAPPSQIKVKGNNANINFGTQLNFPEKPLPRALLAVQRKELHELRAKCEELGDDPWETWRSVHAHLSVSSIDEICAEDFQKAKNVLQDRLEQLQEIADKRRLTDRILRLAAEKDATREMNDFCDLTFGRTELTQLKREELRQILGFLKSIQGQSVPSSAQGGGSSGVLALREFLITYKWNSFGLFVFGVLVGRFWF
ncbi:hypothetical protein [Pseudomonas sp. MRSN 12121]|uniref:hypothetical protein n=1 Tax=Pseudomonas sp. MRSN 12121 TaxID=1611770 RepID=UPI000697B5B1|nr:hypothetical protein [Pseudomonas sp. MRSN 12121]